MRTCLQAKPLPEATCPILMGDGRPSAWFAPLGLLLATLLGCAAEGAAPRIETAAEVVLGEPLGLRITGLAAGERYTVVSERTDQYDRMWRSRAVFRANSVGLIDPACQAPEDGNYDAVDELGLLWSARMPEPPGDDWQPPEPRDFSEIRFSLRRDGVELTDRVVRQWVRPPGVTSETWGEGLVAELFLPTARQDEPLPGLVFLGGSGGGKGWASRMAGLVAGQGFAAVAMAYFNAEGLPEHLAQVPIEPILSAFDQLASHPSVDAERLGVVGYSKGAELALVVASRRPDVRSVVAIAPGSAVFQGFKPPRFPTLSSWSLGGEDLAFVANAYDEKFFETYDGMYLWYRTLAQHEAVVAAAIPVEDIAGDILLLSGVEDRIWPSTYMSEQIVARLYLAEFGHVVQHFAFPVAGHGIAAPPGEPTTSVADRLGGTAAGNARAREQGWRAIREFLSASLG